MQPRKGLLKSNFCNILLKPGTCKPGLAALRAQKEHRGPVAVAGPVAVVGVVAGRGRGRAGRGRGLAGRGGGFAGRAVPAGGRRGRREDALNTLFFEFNSRYENERYTKLANFRNSSQNLTDRVRERTN